MRVLTCRCDELVHSGRRMKCERCSFIENHGDPEMPMFNVQMWHVVVGQKREILAICGPQFLAHAEQQAEEFSASLEMVVEGVPPVAEPLPLPEPWEPKDEPQSPTKLKQPAPRYDEVYAEGMKWLDEMETPSRKERIQTACSALQNANFRVENARNALVQAAKDWVDGSLSLYRVSDAVHELRRAELDKNNIDQIVDELCRGEE